MDLGPDSDVCDVARPESIIHGRFSRLCPSNASEKHFLVIPRALAVCQGELHLLYNCRTNLPFYWADYVGDRAKLPGARGHALPASLANADRLAIGGLAAATEVPGLLNDLGQAADDDDEDDDEPP